MREIEVVGELVIMPCPESWGSGDRLERADDQEKC